MLEALKCPQCSASLEYPKDGAVLRCPYCNTVVTSDQLAGRAASGEPNGAARAEGARMATGLFAGILVAAFVVVMIGVLVAYLMVRAVEKPIRVFASPNIVVPKVIRVPATMPAIVMPASKPAPPPEFARKILEFGVEGVGPGRFQQAECVALDGKGHVFVAESGGGRIQVFDLDGKYITGWQIENARHMFALAVDRKGVLYADVAPDLLRFDALSGKPLEKMDDMNTDVEEYYRDVCVTVDGDVYAIGGNAHIIQFDAAGKIKRTINASEKVGEAVGLARLLVQPTGEIYALDPDRGIFKFANDGRYINRFGKEYVQSIGSPPFFASDSKGRIYLTGMGPSVRVFNGDGGVIDSFGKESAAGIAIGDANEIFASFTSRHLVRKFALEKP